MISRHALVLLNFGHSNVDGQCKTLADLGLSEVYLCSRNIHDASLSLNDGRIAVSCYKLHSCTSCHFSFAEKSR